MLIWENLQDNRCPYCGQKLPEKDEQGIIACVQCYFRIDIEKYLSIKEHRRVRPKPQPRLWWQNLRESKCPACKYLLMDTRDKYEILQCINPDCTFKIRVDRFEEIIADPNHIANRRH